MKYFNFIICFCLVGFVIIAGFNIYEKFNPRPILTDGDKLEIQKIIRIQIKDKNRQIDSLKTIKIDSISKILGRFDDLLKKTEQLTAKIKRYEKRPHYNNINFNNAVDILSRSNYNGVGGLSNRKKNNRTRKNSNK